MRWLSPEAIEEGNDARKNGNHALYKKLQNQSKSLVKRDTVQSIMYCLKNDILFQTPDNQKKELNYDIEKLITLKYVLLKKKEI